MSAVPPVRPDLQLVEGYHSPQVEAEVRLNTNESPFAPPDEWRAELLAALEEISFHRYPDRPATELRLRRWPACTACRPTRCSAPTAPTRNVAVPCCSPSVAPAGTPALRADMHALHSHIARITGTEVVEGSRNDDFLIEPDDAKEIIAARRPDVTFLCSPNNPTGRAEPPGTVAAVAQAAPGLVVVDEAYGQFSPWTALSLRGPAQPGLVVTRTFSKTWALAGARLGYLVADAAVVSACEAVVLPYHPVGPGREAAGLLALRHVPEMEARVARISEERGRVAAALADLPVDSWPSDANFILFRPRGAMPTTTSGAPSSTTRSSSWSIAPAEEGLKGCLQA